MIPADLERKQLILMEFDFLIPTFLAHATGVAGTAR